MISYEVDLIKRIQARAASSAPVVPASFTEATYRTRLLDRMIARMAYLKALTHPSPRRNGRLSNGNSRDGKDQDKDGKQVQSRRQREHEYEYEHESVHTSNHGDNNTHRKKRRRLTSMRAAAVVDPAANGNIVNTVDKRDPISIASPQKYMGYISPEAIQMSPQLYSSLQYITRTNIYKNILPSESNRGGGGDSGDSDDTSIMKLLPPDI